ncbi:unnamed protein product [Candida verbasci]|uniref:Maintenance of mitochondrial morphology protein 1 n=1 Tax=Candida verbasci TaxID=1227364 RepID=A0A9W4TZU4_9ASCO|nr:unnamed protein product [Candida verbasci]
MSKELVETVQFKTTDDYHLTIIDQLKEQLKLQQEDLLLQQKELFSQSNHIPNQSISNNNWSFTQGLIIGQLSVILIITIFIKFFVFADANSISNSIEKDTSNIIVKREKDKIKPNNEEDVLNDEELKIQQNKLKIQSILEKCYYDVHNHSPESLDWFNVLVAQTMSQLRTEALLSDNIYHSLNNFLESTAMPDFMDKINITEIDIGDDFPIFSNCRIKHSKDKSEGRLEAKIDVDLSDTLSLGINTKILLNHPRPLTAILPVSLNVSIIRFSGCLTVSLINTNDQEFIDLKNNNKNNEKDQQGTALMFSFSPDYRLEFVIKSLIGSRAKLQDVPKISSIIENKLRTWFIERCVEPRFQVVQLPSIWPRTKNTREPITKDENVNS